MYMQAGTSRKLKSVGGKVGMMDGTHLVVLVESVFSIYRQNKHFYMDYQTTKSKVLLSTILFIDILPNTKSHNQIPN